MDCHTLLQGIFPIQGSDLFLIMSLALASRLSATWEALIEVQLVYSAMPISAV